jgi:Cu(I)/Ag(I) efflux system membrane fusion protein
MRKAFKPLSDSLIDHLAGLKLDSGAYREIYCPMEEASWLQTGKEIKNPYVGESMPGCGIPKRTF